jgi:hypothetical protein
MTERMFFFEKKNQKTFVFFSARWSEVRDSYQKFFASFFQKRRSFFAFWPTSHRQRNTVKGVLQTNVGLLQRYRTKLAAT